MVKKDQKHWHWQHQMVYLLQLHLWAKPCHSYHRQAATDPYTSRLLTSRVGGATSLGLTSKKSIYNEIAALCLGGESSLCITLQQQS